MSTSASVQTSVQQIDLDIDSWLGAPGADNVITPASNETNKPNIFSSKTTDLSFLENDGINSAATTDLNDKVADDKNVSRGTDTSPNDAPIDDIFNDVDNTNDKKSNGGRPKTEKSGLVEFFKKRIESKEMFAFDDYDEKKQSLDEYLGNLSEKDIDELWEANIDNLKSEIATQTPKEFFESLPQELQYAAKYVADGGQDLKGLFQALSQVETIREMDPSNDDDQEMIVKQYLKATNFGTEDEIEEEITTWKDLNVLEKKAKQFKPKLDQMQEKIVQSKIAEQEELKEQQERMAEAYVTNVFEALRPAEINGIKLDKKTQANLYNGLVQPNYPSINGRPTNQLGHLLEKYQFVEPNYSLIAEALWLLSNPEEYRQTLMKQGKNTAVEQTVRQLKTEQSRKTASSPDDNDEPSSTRKITRHTNIFKR